MAEIWQRDRVFPRFEGVIQTVIELLKGQKHEAIPQVIRNTIMAHDRLFPRFEQPPWYQDGVDSRTKDFSSELYRVCKRYITDYETRKECLYKKHLQYSNLVKWSSLDLMVETVLINKRPVYNNKSTEDLKFPMNRLDYYLGQTLMTNSDKLNSEERSYGSKGLDQKFFFLKDNSRNYTNSQQNQQGATKKENVYDIHMPGRNPSKV